VEGPPDEAIIPRVCLLLLFYRKFLCLSIGRKWMNWAAGAGKRFWSTADGNKTAHFPPVTRYYIND
jgi:hypothetical protein